MFKRVSSIAVTIAMLLTMVWTFSFASADGLMKLTAVADKTEVHPGDTVTVTVGVENYTQPLQAIAIIGNYDKAVLNNTAVETSQKVNIPGMGDMDVSYFPGAVTVNTDRTVNLGEDEGPLYVSWANAENQAKDASFMLCKVTFEVLADATLDETTVQFFFADRSSTYWDETLESDIKTVTCEPDVHYVKNADALVLSVTCDHDWSAWAHVDESNPSQHTRTCSKCSDAETVNCTFDDVVTDPTHLAGGYTTHTCPDCGYSYQDSETDPVDHTYGAWTHKEGTEGADSKHVRTCTENDGGSEEASCTFTDEVVDPTCTEKGYTKHTCGGCGYSYNDTEVDALDHAWGEWTHVEGTEGADAQHTRVCANDATHVETEACSFTDEVVDPTCTEKGYTKHTCGGCGYSYNDTEVDALDHAWGEWTHVEGTEGADAQHTRVCANDAAHVETEACSFEKQETSVAPTCTEDGHDDFKCSVCGYEYSVTVPATAEDGDHTGVVTRYYAPTETEEGRWERYCVDCETVLETEVIAAGHPFDDVTDENVWYYDTAVFCKALGIFEGEYNVFYGDRAITRGEFVTVLCRMLGLTDELLEFVPDEDFEQILVGLAEAFGNDDVKVLNDLGDAWYARQAKVMAAIGVVRGYEDSTFRGESAISREEVAVMLYRLVSINAKLEGTDELPTFGDPAEFNDADTVAGWAAEEVAWAGTSGLFQGDDAGNFCPQGNATRAEMATLIERMALSDGSIVVMEPVVEGA